jgi:hypothetical protein
MTNRVRRPQGSDENYFLAEVEVGQRLDECRFCGALVIPGEGTQAHNQLHQRVGWGSLLLDPPTNACSDWPAAMKPAAAWFLTPVP